MNNSEIETLKNCAIKAIEYLDKKSWDSKNNSRTGDLVYDGILYPTKPILIYILELIKKEKLKVYFSVPKIGEETFQFFEKLGFEIRRKNNDTFKKLIHKYIEILQTKGEPNEKYKYLAISTFQDTWDIDNSDFFEMFKKSFSKVSNLLYQNSWGFIIKCAENYPEETRQLFKDLYNNEIEIEERIKNFQNQSEQLLEKQKIVLNRSNLSAQQDERTISVYLAFRYPEEYILYKSDYYQNYCQEADATSQKTGERFIHLNLLADNWIQHNYLDDRDLQEIYRKFYPKPVWNDTRLMIQNILYVCYRQEKSGGSLVNILNKFDYDDLVHYYSFLDKIISHFNLKQKDKKLVFNFNERQLKFTIGQRYVWNIRAINSKEYTFRAISTTQFSINNGKFDGLPEAFMNNESDFNLIASNSNSIFKAIENELIRTKLSGYSKHNETSIEKLAFDLEYREHIFSQLDKNKNIDAADEVFNKNDMNNFPLNQILYGAPGTGKTYSTKKLAIEIIDAKQYNDATEKDRDIILSRYNELALSNQIHFTTFHQSMGYEDFIEGIKPETSNNKVTYEVKDGVFKKLSTLATDYLYLNEKIDFNFDDSFIKLKQEWQESENGEIEIKMKSSSFFITNIKERNIEFRKASGGYGHELVNKTLKELAYNTRVMDSGLAVYYYPLILKLKSYNSLKKSIKNLKYVLIIDEINRGNVSAIFGELITLLEEDKRKGNKEEIEVILPYSQDKFSVPNNLYIIGTMNTADRSVEALDTALRRRFSFVEMLSKPEKLIDATLDDANEIDLVKLLEIINQRIELLLDKDHQLGHSFFINLKNLDGLKATFKNKIIPLLEEYFFGDLGKIGLVLGENFIAVKNENNNGVLAKFSAYEEIDFITEKKIYQIKNCDELEEADFISIYE